MATKHSPIQLDTGVTVRPSSTALFCIDSADRYKSVVAQRIGTISPYKFNIQKNESLLNGFFTRIALTEIVFPWYVPNINFRTRQLFYNSSIVGNGDITLSTGFYTPTALAAAVQAALIADGVVGVTVTYTNGQFLVDAGVGNTIAFLPATGVPPGSKESQFQLFDLMGFSVANQAVSQFQTSEVTRCRYTEYIDIVCSQLTYNQELKDGSSDPITRDTIARVYLECENDQPNPVNIAGAATNVQDTIPGTYPFTIYRKFSMPKQILWNNTQPLGNLTFEVYDDKGDLLTGFASNDYIYPNWRMSLLVSEN